MFKRVLLAVCALLVVSMALVACGDATATPAPAATTVAAAPAATTAAAGATTAATGATGALASVPPYPGGTVITLPDAVKSQFSSSVGSSVKNPQVGAFTTADDNAKIKAYYTDFFTKNGWKDLSASLGSAASSLDQLGGFYLIYNKDKTVFVVLGLPGSAAAALDPSANVPATGSLVMGFAGDAI